MNPLYASNMTTIEEIERAIERLSASEFAKLREWVVQLDSDVWDRQIASDSSAGRLDAIAQAPVREHREGRSTEL
jgi:hypothetical protein